MFKNVFQGSSILSETRNASRRTPLVFIILFAAFLIILSLLNHFLEFDSFTRRLPFVFQSAASMFLKAAVYISLVLFFVLRIEKRSLKSMGLTGRHAARLFLRGSLIGLAAFGGTAGILLISKTAEISLNLTADADILLLYLAAYILQGMSEEIFFHGFLTVSLTRYISVPAAILISSVLFAIAHVSGSGFTVLAFVNLLFGGIYYAMILLHDDSIFCIIGMHALWNYAEGVLFGGNVSGYTADPGIFQLTMKPGFPLINGGTFGAEGGLADTLTEISILLITAIIVLKIASRSAAGRSVNAAGASHNKKHTAE